MQVDQTRLFYFFFKQVLSVCFFLLQGQGRNYLHLQLGLRKCLTDLYQSNTYTGERKAGKKRGKKRMGNKEKN
jgi:hypothetical protein